MQSDAILEVCGLTKEFPVRTGLLRRQVGTVQAVQDVCFALRRGETLGIVGESGCGKTTLVRSIIRLIEPTSGSVLLRANGSTVDLTTLSGSELRDYRRHVQMIFQDPIASLNPRIPVLEIVGEPLIVNRVCGGKELKDRVGKLLEMVGLTAVDMHRYPHAFSGGQRQRIGIARALALQPELIIADEPVSALDVSVRAQILNLLADLKAELCLSLVFIGHDLGVVRHICDRVAVMYLGRIVEIGPSEQIFSRPGHPYTEALLSAVPVPDPSAQRQHRRVVISGEPPSPINPPIGCAFHPRCLYKIDECAKQVPELTKLTSNVRSACIRAGEITLNEEEM
ncbi:MAG: oligopeptide/dipeptide ABC transporter ATP-binding protein [Armatimonadota bacterium]